MLWQLLLKGLDEVQSAPVPLQAAEMALLRLCHAADLPDPGALVKQLQQQGTTASAPSAPASAPSGAPAAALPAAPPASAPPAGAMPESFEAMVALFRRQSEARLAHHLTDDVRLVTWSPPRLVLAAFGLPKDVPVGIARCLDEWTGQKWQIDWQADGGEPTLREAELARLAALEGQMRADPTVAALLNAFPDAELTPLQQSA